jgi:hypothetical protein
MISRIRIAVSSASGHLGDVCYDAANGNGCCLWHTTIGSGTMLMLFTEMG